MTDIKDLLPKNDRFKGKYSPEEIEQARKIQIAKNSICNPDCEICQGIGFYKNPDSNKVEPCPNADPVKLFPGDWYGLTDQERKMDWSNVVDFNNTWDAVAAIQETMARGFGWVYIWGPPGLGKTLVLKIAVAESLRMKRKSGYARMAEIFDHLRGAFDKDSPSGESQNRLDFWSNLPVLAIDEFDRISGTDWANERRFLLMDRRYESALREKTVTLMTSNNNPAGLSGYLFDRIQDARFQIIHVLGDSFRIGAE